MQADELHPKNEDGGLRTEDGGLRTENRNGN